MKHELFVLAMFYIAVWLILLIVVHIIKNMSQNR